MTRGILVALAFLAGAAAASGQTIKEREVVGSGGYIQARSGLTELSGTIGQPVIGIVSTTQNRLSQGFWLPIALSTTSVDDGGHAIGNADVSNYPNPFTTSTTFRFQTPYEGPVTIRVYDMVGNLVRTLTGEFNLAGAQEMTWDGRDEQGGPLSSGSYIYEVQGMSALDGRPMQRVQRLQIVR